jgi:hypothetical protein
MSDCRPSEIPVDADHYDRLRAKLRIALDALNEIADFYEYETTHHSTICSKTALAKIEALTPPIN